uniref:MHD domain-containing protein n=1 Tax=Parastrongyloides trichosuri TaxID=131310 RepID=A0A0N5A0D7_PARTI
MLISHIKPQFNDRFWSEKNEGYLNLYDSLVKNEETVHKFLSYVREVLNCEDLSIKNLEKLINRSSDLSNCGSNFDATFSLIKACNAAKKESKANLIEGLSSLVKEITDHLCEVSKNRKAIKELNVSNVFKEMTTAKHDLEKAEDVYKSRYEDLLTFNKNNGSAKECSKLENKVKKANDEYRNIVEKYNKLREEYENKMVFTVQTVAQYLESHYIKMKNFISKLANNFSSSATLDSISTSDFEDSLKGIDVIAMLNNFVGERSTSGLKPEKYIIQDNVLSQESLEMPPLLPSSNSLASSTNSSAKLPPLTNEINNSSQMQDLLTMDLPMHLEENLTGKNSLMEVVKDKSFDLTTVSEFGENSLSKTSNSYKGIQSQNSIVGTSWSKKNSTSSFNRSIESNIPENFEFVKNNSVIQDESTIKIQQNNMPNNLSHSPTKKLFSQTDYEVDEEGYTIRRECSKDHANQSETFDSDSSDDGDFGKTKRVFKKLYIKPKDESITNINNEKSLETIRDTMGNINKSWMQLSRIPKSENPSPVPTQNQSNTMFSQSFTSPSLKQSYSGKEIRATTSIGSELFLQNSMTNLNASMNDLLSQGNMSNSTTRLNPIARPRPRPMSTTNIFAPNYNASCPVISESTISENGDTGFDNKDFDNENANENSVDNLRTMYSDKSSVQNYSFATNFSQDQESYSKTYSNSINSDYSTPSEKGSTLFLSDTLSRKSTLARSISIDNCIFKPHFSVIETIHVQGNPENNFNNHKMCIYGVIWMSVRNELYNKLNNSDIYNTFTDVTLSLETKKYIKNWKMNEKVLVSVIRDATNENQCNLKIGKTKIKNWIDENYIKHPKQPFYCIEILRYELSTENIVPPFIILPRRKMINNELLFYMKWSINQNQQNELRVFDVKKFAAKLLFGDIKDIKIKSIEPFGNIHKGDNEIVFDEQSFKSTYIREGEFKAIVLTNGKISNFLRASLSFEVVGCCFSLMNIRMDKNDNSCRVAEIRHSVKSGKYFATWLGES